jgi:hypothetical protein
LWGRHPLTFAVPFLLPRSGHPDADWGEPAETVGEPLTLTPFRREGDMHPARRQELKQLVEIYAVRTRELSDSIAFLGGHVAAGRPIGESMTEIKRRRSLVEKAATDLFAFVWPLAEEAPND